MLTDDEAIKLRGMLRHPGWLEVVAPRAVARGRGFLQTLVQSESERPGHQKKLSDDQIRGMYRDVEWFLTNWEKELRAYDHNKAIEKNGEPVESANPTERS